MIVLYTAEYTLTKYSLLAISDGIIDYGVLITHSYEIGYLSNQKLGNAAKDYWKKFSLTLGQKMKFSIRDLFSKCDLISYFIFCVVLSVLDKLREWIFASINSNIKSGYVRWQISKLAMQVIFKSVNLGSSLLVMGRVFETCQGRNNAFRSVKVKIR